MKTISKKLSSKNLPQSDRTSYQLINSGLFSLCGAMILCYIVWANAAAGGNYAVSQLREHVTALTEVNSALSSGKITPENPNEVLEFAVRQQMIPAQHASYIFENGDVALK
ncbi:hypothetical protein KW791_03305 [Candidatus Parcubacteria bacterium]|nr:hypothetical protein [Candidatus Parcubacteria bacterium]